MSEVESAVLYISKCFMPVSGAVDILEKVNIKEQKESQGVKRVQGFCPLRAARDGGSVDEGLPDLAFRISEDAQLRTDLSKVFKGEMGEDEGGYIRVYPDNSQPMYQEILGHVILLKQSVSSRETFSAVNTNIRREVPGVEHVSRGRVHEGKLSRCPE